MPEQFTGTRWLLYSKVLIITSLLLFGVYSAIEEGTSNFLTNLIYILGFIMSILATVCIYKDMDGINASAEWPAGRLRYLGLMWIPLFGVIPSGIYYINRKNMQRDGKSKVSVSWLKYCVTNVGQSVKWLYGGIGTFLTVFGLFFIFYLLSADALLPDEHWLQNLAAILVFYGVAGVFFIDIYASEEIHELLHTAFRDITVRMLAPLNCLILVFLLVWPLIFLVTLLLLPLALISQSLYVGMGLGLLFSIFIVPLAMALVLPLRLLPWLKTIPFVVKNFSSYVKSLLKQRFQIGRDNHQAESKSRGELFPTSGFDHTDVTIKSDTDVEFAGTYGYHPRPLADLKLKKVSYSVRWGVLLLIPGWILATIVLGLYQYRPEETLALASLLPADDILIVALSYIGLPQSAAEGLLAVVGLPEETLALGFIGVVLPAILMIPGAWHFALKYEVIMYDYLQKVQLSNELGYRILRRFDTSNHLTLLWLTTLIPIIQIIIIWRKLRHGFQTVLSSLPFTSGHTAE